jgi:predicted nucleic acid-binding protein
MLKGFQNINTIITDASCFILFDKLACLQLLEELYGRVYTTPEIAKEYGKILPQFVIVQAVKNTSLLHTYAEIVDIGEASALALAGEVEAPSLISDDLKGRNLASKLKFEFTGSAGVLVLAKQRGIIPSLIPYFDKIKESNFRITERFLQILINKYEQ